MTHVGCRKVASPGTTGLLACRRRLRAAVVNDATGALRAGTQTGNQIGTHTKTNSKRKAEPALTSGEMKPVGLFELEPGVRTKRHSRRCAARWKSPRLPRHACLADAATRRLNHLTN